MALVTLLGNTVTLLYRLTWNKTLLQKSYGMFVTNLGVSDLLMSGYLGLIAVADVSFQGEYVLHDYTWRNGNGCRAAGTIATLSSITSTVFVFLITVDRFFAVRYPFGEVRFTHKTTAVAVIGAWIFGISIAFLPVLPFAQNWGIYSSSGMCLGLPLSRERLPGWQYSVTVFIGQGAGGEARTLHISGKIPHLLYHRRPYILARRHKQVRKSRPS
ncbi:G-protein coupled receptor grl101 [Plakobranchus ocellatus]|uniref:G-protein coupled receptor grl101 n=1 Tax=Plakobranchus ocellatus TaxID=259542 RepID=A0AAV4C825_9GAST|nr:G-protein coupled receptor grl101 [Plakobranchus ocellatus]